MNYSTLWIFDCSVYSLVDSQKKNKLESKSKKCIFIGFTKRVKIFRLCDPHTKRVFTSRDLIFDERSMLQEKSETENKAQGGASDSLAGTQKRELSSQRVLKGLKGQKRTSQVSDGDEHEATQENLHR